MSCIFIQDNFFEEDIFKKIKLEIPTVEFTPPPKKLGINNLRIGLNTSYLCYVKFKN